MLTYRDVKDYIGNLLPTMGLTVDFRINDELGIIPRDLDEEIKTNLVLKITDKQNKEVNFKLWVKFNGTNELKEYIRRKILAGYLGFYDSVVGIQGMLTIYTDFEGNHVLYDGREAIVYLVHPDLPENLYMKIEDLDNDTKLIHAVYYHESFKFMRISRKFIFRQGAALHMEVVISPPEMERIKSLFDVLKSPLNENGWNDFDFKDDHRNYSGKNIFVPFLIKSIIIVKIAEAWYPLDRGWVLDNKDTLSTEVQNELSLYNELEVMTGH